MSAEQLLSQFDLTLSQDVVRDVQATGVPFTKEIWGNGSGKRDLLGCIVLDKDGQDVVRLKFKVYNRNDQDGANKDSQTDYNGENKDSQTEKSETNKDSQTDHTGVIKEDNETSDTSVQAEQETEAKKSQTEEEIRGEIGSQTEHSGTIKNNDTSEMSVQVQQETGVKKSQTEKEEQEEISVQTENKEQKEQHQQTKILSFEESFVQTVETEQFEQISQTDKTELFEQTCQTEEKEQFEQISQTDHAVLEESFMQTDEADLVETFIQTEPTPSTEQCHQTDPLPVATKYIQVGCDSEERYMQTDIATMLDTPVQTELEMCEQKCQTDPTSVTHCDVQASVEMCINSAQTDIKEYVDTNMQTELKVDQKGVQTLKLPVKHIGIETEPMIVIDPEEQFENDAQTDPVRVIDPMLDREVGVQTEYGKVIYPEIMYDNVCQTDDIKLVALEDQEEGASQTDFVFITQPEDLQDNVVQTDNITILNPEKQVSQDTQTNLVWVTGLQQDEHATTEVTQESALTLESQEPIQESIVPEPEMLPEPPLLDHMQPGLDEQQQELNEPKSNAVIEEKWVQTDPVTIIIGDSSFLLQQLANINKSPEVTPTQIPPRRKPGRPPGSMGSQYTRARPDIQPPMLERQGIEQVPAHLSTESHAEEQQQLNPTEMPTLEAEDKPRRGVRMLLPKKNPYRAPYSVSGMSPHETSNIRPQHNVQGESVVAAPQYSQQMQHQQQQFHQQQQIYPHQEYTEEQQQVPEDPGPKGKFNCPFCTSTYDDTPALYKHIHEDHGTPRCSTRKARRKGTIIVDDDGSMHIVGEQNTLWELNEENMKRYRKTKRYQQRTPRYTPRRDNMAMKEEGEILGPNLVESSIGDSVEDEIEQDSIDDHEVTLQIVQNGVPAIEQPVAVKSHEPAGEEPPATTFPETSNPTPAVPESSSAVESSSEAEPALRRAFNCPRCPRLFTKSSELYIHLQSSHKNSGRGRGRGRGAYHQLQIVDIAEGEQEIEEGQLVVAQPDLVPKVHEDDEGEEDGLEEGQVVQHEHEVEIQVEYREEPAQEPEQEQLPEPPVLQQEQLLPGSLGEPEQTEEDLPTIKVARRGRPPKIKKEPDAAPEVRNLRGKRKIDEEEPVADVAEVEDEVPKRGRRASVTIETPAKRGPGRPPAKRGRRN